MGTSSHVESGSENGRKEIRHSYALIAGAASLVTVTVLILIKIFAYVMSGSASVLASLIDSMMDAVTSVISFLAIRYSLKPADHEHRFGHGKIEGLAAMFQAAFISGAGVFLVFEAAQRFARPEETEESTLVIGIMLVSTILSVVLVTVQNFSLKHAPSLAVEADKAHYTGDIALNAGVIFVLIALKYGAPVWIDPAFAILVAGHLGLIAYNIAMKGMDMLLDRELPDEMRAQILDIINRNPDVRGVHDLRTRKSGMNIYMSFDIELDPDKTLREAHETVIVLEARLLELFPNAEILIHKDPVGVDHTDSRHQVSGVHK